MTSYIKVSVIIPIYNTEEYLIECLNSIVNQTLKEIEIICVDDGSTDCSPKIIKEYQKKDNRIILIEEQHKGVGNARNQGAKIARGKYIQFLDSDDFFEPTMLEELYQNAERHNVEITICSAAKYDEISKICTNNQSWPINLNTAILNKPFHWKECADIFNMFAPEPWSSFYNREFFNKNNLMFPDISSSNGACLGLFARILANKILIINKPFINYRFLRNNSISSQKDVMNIIKQRINLKNLLFKYNIYNDLNDSYNTNFTRAIEYIISNCKTKEEYISFIERFEKLFPSEYEKYRHIIEQEKNIIENFHKFVIKEKTMFWGASVFLEKYLKDLNNKNIVGIIDKNIQKQGSKLGSLEIFSPDILDEKEIKTIILTVRNKNKTIYEELKLFLKEKHPEIELLPNIFK